MRAFFCVCDFCDGLGSGTTNNVDKSFVKFIGVDREKEVWAPAEAIGVGFVPDGSTMTVTGLEVGYGQNLQATIWSEKITRVLRSLRTWLRIDLSAADRVLIFRAMAMSVSAFGAGPVPPTTHQIKKMEAIRIHFVLTGKVPAGDGTGAFTTHSKISGAEIARPAANGGRDLPTIAHWNDELNVARVLRLMDPWEQTQKWTQFIFRWVASRLGVWGAKATTGPAQNSATLGVCKYLARFNETVNALTLSKLMPPHWRARFQSFFRAKALTTMQPIESVDAARAEPLWHNGQLQAVRGV